MKLKKGKSDVVIAEPFISTQDVINDFELQDWADDVANNGLHWQKNNDKRMPDKITSVEQLVGLFKIQLISSFNF